MTLFERFTEIIRKGRKWLRINLTPEEERIATAQYVTETATEVTAQMGFLKVELAYYPNDEEFEDIAFEVNALAGDSWIVQPFLKGKIFPPWFPGRKELWLRTPVTGEGLKNQIVKLIQASLDKYDPDEFIGVGWSIRPTESSTGLARRKDER